MSQCKSQMPLTSKRGGLQKIRDLREGLPSISADPLGILPNRIALSHKIGSFS